MRDPDEFDAFYRDARERLLLQTYALTGDLAAARSAVRDAFVIAWHHWTKATRSGDPEAWVRPHAWAHAQRRHTARPWHREKGLEPEVKATFDALGKLSTTQRRLLLLTFLAAGSPEQFAREVGLPTSDADRELQTAMAQLAIHRGVPSAELRTLFTPMSAVLADVRLPRASILRRAGARRRRAHTLVGVGLAAAVAAASGVLVTETGASGVRATLDRTAVSSPRPDREPAPEPPALDEDSMLTAEQVDARAGGRWTERATHDNTSGSGLVLPCQQARYADPRGAETLVRTFAGGRGSATQMVEASGSERAARRAYRTLTAWLAGCTDERTQLLATQQVSGAGDEGVLLVLRDWTAPVTTHVAAVARTGQLTSTVVASAPGARRPRTAPALGLLADAVSDLCDLPGAGSCVTTPRAVVRRPLPAGVTPGMLSVVDLPPVRSVDLPWAGTEAQRADQNFAATACDNASFSGRFRGRPWSRNLTRSFLVPQARLPARFGLTQTVGALPVRSARAFVATVRQRLDGCPERNLAADVDQVTSSTGRSGDLLVWRVVIEVSDRLSVEYLVALARRGTAVTQLGFVPSGRAQIAERDFVDLARRAQERLADLPAPRR